VYEFTVSGMYIPDFLITTGGIPFASFAAEQRCFASFAAEQRWWPNSDEGTMSALCAEQRWESARPHTNFPKFVHKPNSVGIPSPISRNS
jgi:hypothetical protein